MAIRTPNNSTYNSQDSPISSRSSKSNLNIIFDSVYKHGDMHRTKRSFKRMTLFFLISFISFIGILVLAICGASNKIFLDIAIPENNSNVSNSTPTVEQPRNTTSIPTLEPDKKNASNKNSTTAEPVLQTPSPARIIPEPTPNVPTISQPSSPTKGHSIPTPVIHPSDGDSSSFHPLLDQFTPSQQLLFIYVQCVVVCLSVWSCFIILLLYIMFKSFRTYVIPFVINLSISQFIYYLVAIIELLRSIALGKRNLCQGYIVVISFFNFAQILWTCAIAYNFHKSVITYADIVMDSTKLKKRMMWIHIFVWGISGIGASVNYYLSEIRKAENDYISLNSIFQCGNTAIWLNFVALPLIAFAFNLVAYTCFRRVVRSTYPQDAKNRLYRVTHAYFIAFIFSYGTLLLYTVIEIHSETPFILALFLVTSYNMQGICTSIVTICHFYRFRQAFDYGLHLKAIAPCSIHFDKPTIILGEGTFGTVLKATWTRPKRVSPRNIPVAVKIFCHSDVDKMREEAYLASKLVHPNVMCTYGCYSVDTSVCIVTEYLSQGTLDDILMQEKPLEYHVIINYALMIAKGMQFLHGLAVPIIHRDLKPLNCLFDEHHILKVADFGASRLFTNRQDNGTSSPQFFPEENERRYMSNLLGSPCWRAPELLIEESHSRYSLKIDVYSFGILCWQLLCGEPRPFKEIPGSLLALEEIISSGYRPSIPSTYSFFKSLIRCSWAQDPQNRPSFDTIVISLEKELFRYQESSCISKS